MQPDEQKPTDQTNETAQPLTQSEDTTVTSAPPVTEPATEAVSDPSPDQPEATTEPAAEPTAAADEPSTTPVVDQSTADETPSSAPESVSNADPSQPSDSSNTPAATAGVVAAAPIVASASGSKKGKKKLWIIGGIVAIVLLLIAGSAAAYYGVFLPNQPQKITGDALANTVNNEKFKSTKFEGEVTVSGGDVSKVLSSVGFEGGVNAESQAVDLKVTVNTAVTKVNFDVRSLDGKSAYVRLSGLNGLDKLLAAAGESSEEAATVSQFAPLLSQVNDKWFTLDQSLLNQVSGTEMTNTGKLSNQDAQRIGEIYKKHQFLNVDKRLADESIHGVASYHIKATVNKDQLKSFLGELKSANINNLKIEQKDIDELNKVDFSKYPLEMWVSKKDRFITQLSSAFEDKGTTYKVRVALKDINQPVSVEKPADAHSILELLGGISQQSGTNPLFSL